MAWMNKIPTKAPAKSNTLGVCGTIEPDVKFKGHKDWANEVIISTRQTANYSFNTNNIDIPRLIFRQPLYFPLSFLHNSVFFYFLSFECTSEADSRISWCVCTAQPLSMEARVGMWMVWCVLELLWNVSDGCQKFGNWWPHGEVMNVQQWWVGLPWLQLQLLQPSVVSSQLTHNDLSVT